MSTIHRVGIVGAGTMGHGIAQVCATSGIEAQLLDVHPAALDKAQAAIASSLERLVKKDKLSSEARAAALARIRTTTTLADLAACDFVIEAATENEALKIKLLKELDTLLPPAVVIASNTSSISITTLAAATSRPDRFIGMHFFNPVPLMALVELIRGLATSEATLAQAKTLAERLGKTAITVKNSPGFVVNRILCPMINEAIFCLQEGLASAEEIDTGMKLGCNHPIGPLALADMIGLDVMLAVMEVFYTGFNDPKYRPAPLLKELVAAGHLGRKTGRGIYLYA